MVQNFDLWQKFQQEVDQVAKLAHNKGNPNIMGLWHGTGTNKPEVIATTGFDIAYSEDLGYWGRGIYFAQDAKYSAPTYCYKPEGTKNTY